MEQALTQVIAALDIGELARLTDECVETNDATFFRTCILPACIYRGHHRVARDGVDFEKHAYEIIKNAILLCVVNQPITERDLFSLIEALRVDCLCCLTEDTHTVLWRYVCDGADCSPAIRNRLLNNCFFCVQSAFLRCVTKSHYNMFKRLLSTYTPAFHVFLEAVARGENQMVQDIFGAVKKTPCFFKEYYEEMNWTLGMLRIMDEDADEIDTQSLPSSIIIRNTILLQVNTRRSKHMIKQLKYMQKLVGFDGFLKTLVHGF